jgi:hypothetical protein
MGETFQNDFPIVDLNRLWGKLRLMAIAPFPGKFMKKLVLFFDGFNLCRLACIHWQLIIKGQFRKDNSDGFFSTLSHGHQWHC